MVLEFYWFAFYGFNIFKLYSIIIGSFILVCSFNFFCDRKSYKKRHKLFSQRLVHSAADDDSVKCRNASSKGMWFC